MTTTPAQRSRRRARIRAARDLALAELAAWAIDARRHAKTLPRLFAVEAEVAERSKAIRRLAERKILGSVRERARAERGLK